MPLHLTAAKQCVWQVRVATPQEITDLVEAIWEYLPSKDAKQLRSTVKRGLGKARKVVITSRGPSLYIDARSAIPSASQTSAIRSETTSATPPTTL